MTTNTTSTQEPFTCQRFECESDLRDWSVKCNDSYFVEKVTGLHICSTCEECVTTTTYVATNTTTSTTTNTTFTTTTTTIYNCAAPSRVYPFNESDCATEIPPGTSCSARTKDHKCIAQATFDFACLDLNDKKMLNPQLLAVTGDSAANYGGRVRCQVCDLQQQNFEDTVQEESLVGPITFEFGPNSLDGTVDELDIEEYEVWFADECGNLLGPQPVTSIPVQGREENKEAMPTLPQGCCTNNAYKIEIESAYLPKGYKNVSVVIVPFTTSVQRLTFGAVVGTVADAYVSGWRWSGPARTSGATRGFGSCEFCMVFVACASIFSMSAAVP
jgi:hypothetical protein